MSEENERGYGDPSVNKQHYLYVCAVCGDTVDARDIDEVMHHARLNHERRNHPDSRSGE